MIRTPRDGDFELPLSKRKDFPVTLRVTHSEFKMNDLENYVLLENAGNFLQIRGHLPEKGFKFTFCRYFAKANLDLTSLFCYP